MKVPKQLRNEKFRFVKTHGKAPFESGWQNLTYNYHTIEKWLQEGHNYGIIGGHPPGLIILDGDSKQFATYLKKHLKTLQTANPHFYLMCPEWDLGCKSIEKAGLHHGDVKSAGGCVIAPPSIHPVSHDEYKFVNDVSIAEITKDKLLDLINDYIDKDKLNVSNSKINWVEQTTSDFPSLELDISKILSYIDGLTFKNGEYVGPHPIHGSNGGENFHINVDKGVWKCFRDGHGGGDALYLIAMLEGILDCSECYKGMLRGEPFKKVVGIAKTKYGYEVELNTVAQNKDEFVHGEAQKIKRVYPIRTLKEVEELFGHWLHMTNFEYLHTAMATILSAQKRGTPVWIIFVAPSGDRKSAVLRAFKFIDIGTQLLYLDELTEKTLASGMKNRGGGKVKDLGGKLADNDTIIITPDLASLTAKDKKEKRVIWSKLRELFDHYISKWTGNEVVRDYENCFCTWLFGAVPAIKNEILIFTELGTRELLYDVSTSDKDTDAQMEKAWFNEEEEETMKKELAECVAGFMRTITYDDDVVISRENHDWINREVKKLELLRASVGRDRRTNTLYCDMTKAKPMRTMKQFKKLWKALKSINPDFTDDYIKKILQDITVSNANNIRYRILQHHKNNQECEMTIEKYAEMLRVGEYAIIGELGALWNMHILKRRMDYETVGQTLKEVGDKQWLSGGRTIKVYYYSLEKDWKKTLDEYIGV